METKTLKITETTNINVILSLGEPKVTYQTLIDILHNHNNSMIYAVPYDICLVSEVFKDGETTIIIEGVDTRSDEEYNKEALLELLELAYVELPKSSEVYVYRVDTYNLSILRPIRLQEINQFIQPKIPTYSPVFGDTYMPIQQIQALLEITISPKSYSKETTKEVPLCEEHSEYKELLDLIKEKWVDKGIPCNILPAADSHLRIFSKEYLDRLGIEDNKEVKVVATVYSNRFQYSDPAFVNALFEYEMERNTGNKLETNLLTVPTAVTCIGENKMDFGSVLYYGVIIKDYRK